MNKPNNPGINPQTNHNEQTEINLNDSKDMKFSSRNMLENLSEDYLNEALDKNELYNTNVPTVRIKKENMMSHSINFDKARETLQSKHTKDKDSDNDQKTAIFNDHRNSYFRKTDNLKEEVKKIEEHFINTNRDFKPILYDEDLNAKIEEENIKQKTEFKEDSSDVIEYNKKQENEIINKFKNIDFENNMFQNKADNVKEEDINEKDEINFKETNYKNTNNNENELNHSGNNYNHAENLDDYLKDTLKVGNYRNENFANTDNIMLVSFIEDKIKFDRKGIFYGMNKIYLFINKRSGSQEGKIILDLTSKHHKNFVIKDSDANVFNELYQNINIVKINNKKPNNENEKTDDIYVFLVDILSLDSKSSGIESLRIDTSHGKNSFLNLYKKIEESVKVLIAGGDGTVLQVVEDLHKKNIHIENCIFGHVPLGTGNDLSNSMGFGSKIDIPHDLGKFENLISSYYNAKETSIDIWQMRLTLEGIYGDMIKVDNHARRSSLRGIDEDLKKKSVFRKTFINYLSLGYDARVGYGFDKSRSSCRCWNKCIYFWEGFKKNCCTRTAGINKIIDRFEEIEEEEEPVFNKKQSENNLLKNNQDLDSKDKSLNEESITTRIENKKNRNIIFLGKGEDSNKKEQLEKNKKFLKGNPVNLICQNINYYMGGTKDIWRKSLTKIAFEKNSESYIKKVRTWNQRSNDGKLEFFSYSSGFELGLEKIKPGNANKVHQGKGPFVITFKDMSHISVNDKVNRVFLNVDGEYYKLLRPVEMRIRLNKKLNNGSIRFIAK